MCREFGIDPGAILDDDFLAWQLRLGLAGRSRMAEQAAEEEAEHERVIQEKRQKMMGRG